MILFPVKTPDSSIFCISNAKQLTYFNEYSLYLKKHKQLGLFDPIRVFCLAQSENNPPPLFSNVVLIYLLTTGRVRGYPIIYPVGYPGNELPDNGSLTTDFVVLVCCDGDELCFGEGEGRH